MSFEVKLGELKRKLSSQVCPALEEVSRELDRFGDSLPIKEVQEIARSLSEVGKAVREAHKYLTGRMNPRRKIFIVNASPSFRSLPGRAAVVQGWDIYCSGILVGFVSSVHYNTGEIFYTLTPGGKVSSKESTSVKAKGFSKTNPITRIKHLILYWNSPKFRKYLKGLTEVEKKMRENGAQEDPRFLPEVPK